MRTTLTVTLLGTLVSLPILLLFHAPSQQQRIGVMFPLNWSREQAFSAITSTGNEAIRRGRHPALWVINTPAPKTRTALKQSGAIVLFNPILLEGCGFYTPIN